jgi:hypothetical protein
VETVNTNDIFDFKIWWPAFTRKCVLVQTPGKATPRSQKVSCTPQQFLCFEYSNCEARNNHCKTVNRFCGPQTISSQETKPHVWNTVAANQESIIPIYEKKKIFGKVSQCVLSEFQPFHNELKQWSTAENDRWSGINWWYYSVNLTSNFIVMMMKKF